MAKKRLDVLLFEKGLCPSRERAKTAIMEGIVYIAGQKAGKAGDMVDENAELEVRGNENAFVSRGGINFLYKIREAGITVPVIPGIMPITNANQVQRAIKLSGSFMPQRFKSLVDRFGDDPAAMKQAGIAYATDQIIDLYANGITNVHVYSMNKPDVAAKIQGNLSDILGK